MALFRVVDVGINAPFENVNKGSGLRVLLARCLGQLDVQEGGDMSEIEDASVPQLDWFLGQGRLREHLTCDNVPGRPERRPVDECRERLRRIERGVEREGEFRLLGEVVDTCFFASDADHAIVGGCVFGESHRNHHASRH